MNINELDSFNLADAVKFHRRLNPRIWGRDEHLLPEVREKLLAIAADFQEFLGVEDLDVQDITVSGSNAAYSYTKNSDIDLHLVVKMPDDPVYQELFSAKKYQYNDEHNIKIGGADVELYVQPSDQTHVSQGVYSVKDNKWLSIPRRKRAEIDDVCVRDKVADLDARIHSAVKSGNESRISSLADKIKAMRKAGLDAHGEFGCENVAFKILRNKGCIKLLWDARAAARDRELSLREAPRKKFRYGFSEGHQGSPYSSEDGVAASTKMYLSETDDEHIVNQFIQHTASELGLDPLPNIKLHTDPEWSEHNHSFGRYDPDTHTLNVSMPNRHILDVLRTVAHELVHCSQHQQHGDIPDDAGETGSEWENDANARAGIIMRDWANTHPEHFEHQPLEENASGYIPKNKKEARKPQYAMALSVDVHPGQVGTEANKLALQTGRNGEPGLLMKTANLRESFDLLDEGAIVTRIDSKPITDFASNLKAYKHTDDWSQSGVDTGDDSWWKNKNLKTNTTKGLFAGDPHRTALYATGNAHETRYVEFTQNGQPVVYFDKKDLPAMRSRKTYLTVFDASNFKKLPTGEWFSENPGKPIKQTPIGDPFKYIADQGWIVRVTDDLDKVFKQVKQMHKAGKIGQYGAEGMTESLREPGLLQPDAQNLLREFSEFVTEQENLFEISMSPTSLKKLSAQTGARAGMEFEMIVPGVRDEDQDREPDYDYDERARSIDDICNFFYDGDFNGRRQIDDLRRRLTNSYEQWADDQIQEDWDNQGMDLLYQYVKNNVDDETIIEALGLEPDEEGDLPVIGRAEWAQYAELCMEEQNDVYDEALQEFRDDWYNDDDHESDWLDSEGLAYMSNVEQEYGGLVTWPHWNDPAAGQTDVEQVADDFSAAIGRKVNWSRSYHGGKREPNAYVVEPDSSLDPDDPNDSGLEFVSPPLPIEELLSDLNTVKAWADRRGCYTNDSTGLHINVSVPGWSGDYSQLDYVKLAVLLGDEYVLDVFGRAGNTYAKSAIGKIRTKIKQNPDKAEELLTMMKSGMNQLASKAIHSGSTEKYTSINTKTGYIEFRSPGGDWLDANFDQIENTLRRFTVALSAAVDPEAYRKEYLKKLYKLLDVGSEKDPLSYFAKYAAGELPRAALKSFVRQARLEREVKRGKETGPMWWRVYKEGKNARNGAMIEVVASSEKEAKEKAAKEWREPLLVSTLNQMDAEPLRPYKEETKGPELNGRPSNPDGNYVIVNGATNEPAYRYMASDGGDALTVLQQWITAHRGSGIQWNIKLDPNQSLGQPDQIAPPRGWASATQQAQSQQGNWGIWMRDANRFSRAPDQPDNSVLRRFPSREAAEQFIARAQQNNPNIRSDIEVREIEPGLPGRSANQLSQTDIENRLGWPDQTGDANYEVVDRQTMQPVFKFVANTAADAERKYTQVLDVMMLPHDTAAYGWRAIGDTSAPAGTGRPNDPTGRYAIVARNDTAAYGRRGGPAPYYYFRFNMGNPEEQRHGRYVLQAWAARNNVNSSDYMVVDTEEYADSGTAQDLPNLFPDLPRPQGQFTGEWKILVNGEEVHRFGGIGNVQADANRVAAQWLRDNGRGVSGEGFEVVPVMSESLREYRMPQPSHGPGAIKDLNEPLGPETPPKMPDGTIKVDVSDMYDWYKLGQKISDLDSIKPGELGSGPPSTVFAFGSEDLENMYSHELTRLGLKTHDLDEPGEEDIDEAAQTQKAAGIILYAEDTGRFGLQQRSDTVNDPGVWAAWGGGRKPGESLEQCARRELAEEGGYTGDIKLSRLGSNPEYVTFIGRVPHEFEPRANSEWKDHCWVEAGDWPAPLHPGTAAALKRVSIDENFADGKKPGRKGLAKRMGVNTKASVSSLRKTAKHSTGEKARMAHWLANMKAGRAKANEAKIGTLHFPTVIVDIDDHAIDRANTRKVNVRSIDAVLKKLESITDQLLALELGNKVWVYDPALNVSLGMRRISSRQPKFLLKSVLPSAPHAQGATDIINIPQQLGGST